MNEYEPQNQEALQKLLGASRMISAVLSSNPEKLQIFDNSKNLKDSFEKFLSEMEAEKVPNKKLL